MYNTALPGLTQLEVVMGGEAEQQQLSVTVRGSQSIKRGMNWAQRCGIDGRSGGSLLQGQEARPTEQQATMAAVELIKTLQREWGEGGEGEGGRDH